MNLRKIFTIGFVSLLMFCQCSVMNAQDGFVRVLVRVKSLQGTAGMPGYIYPNPSVNYYVGDVIVKDADGNQLGKSVPQSWGYPNQASDIEHFEYALLFDERTQGDELTNQFDLSKSSSLSIYFDRLQGSGTAGTHGFYTLPYTLPFSYIARSGNYFTDLTISISGNVEGYGQIPYPYHFKFEAAYDVHAIKPDLLISGSDGDQTTFCEGQIITITAEHKDNFKNGTFEFQKKYPTSGWITIPSRRRQASVNDVATQSGVIYRARLKATSSTYGVIGYDQWWGVATSKKSITVNLMPDDIYYKVWDVCEGDFEGSVQITGLPGAQIGKKYKIELKDKVSNSLYSQYIIDSYTNDYFSANTVLLPAKQGSFELNLIDISENSFRCELTTPIFNVKNNITTEFSTNHINATCPGGDGEIKLTPNQAVSGIYSHRIYSITTGEIFTASTYRTATFRLPAGKYLYLDTEDDNGCIYPLVPSTDTIVITEPEPLVATLNADEVIIVDGMEYHGCADWNVTTFELNISGGTPPYTVQQKRAGYLTQYFRLLPDQNSLRFPRLGIATYEFIITDSRRCAFNPIQKTVRLVPPPTFPELTIQKPTVECSEVGSDGSISQLGEPTGGVPPFDLYFNEQLVPSFDTSNLSNMYAQLKIVDSVGCVFRDKADVFDDTFLDISNDGEFTNSVIPCGSSQIMGLIVKGGKVSSGKPYVLIYNGVNCDDDPNCHLDYFDPSTPFAGYRITLFDGGMHTFEVSDTVDCVATLTEVIEEPKIPKIESMSIVPPNCLGGIYDITFYLNDLNTNEFTSPHIYYEIDGITGSTQPTIVGGVYNIPYEFTLQVSGDSLHKITVKDNFNCGDPNPFEFTLTALDALTLSVDLLNNSSCSYDTSGVIGFSMTGDIPYQVELFKDGIRIDSLEVTADEYSFDKLLAGSYQIDIVDGKGCFASETNILLSIPDTIKANVASTSTIDCTGRNGNIQISNLSGGTTPYTFSLNNQEFQADPLLLNAELENEIIIRDSNNCVLNLSLSIPEAGPTLLPTFSIETEVSDCSLGNALISLPPGFTYPLYITEIGDPTMYNWIDTLLIADSLATIMFSDTLKSLTVGKHYYYIKDGLGCETIDSIEMTVATPLTATVLNKTIETCYQQSKDGQFTVRAQGGKAPYEITLFGDTSIITNDSTSFTGLNHGEYYILIRDDNGCQFNLRDSIDSRALPLLSFTTANYTGCVGQDLTGEITLSGSNGTAPYSFEWEDGNMDNPRSGLAPGAYNVTMSDQNGCMREVVAVVESQDSLVLNVNATQDVTCQADSTGEISVSTIGSFPPYTFSINDGNTFQSANVFTGLPIGKHTILVKDSNDCTDTTSANITYTNPLTATVEVTNESCTLANDGTLEVTILGGITPFTYSLDNIDFQFQNIFTGLSAGSYEVWIKDGSGCKAVYTDNIITEPTELSLSTSVITSETCSASNGSISGTAIGGTPPYTYVWNGDATLNTNTLSDVPAGSYTLVVSDANLCTASSLLVLTDSPSPILSIQSKQDEFCGMSNGQITFEVASGLAPFVYTWSHDATLNDSIATGLTSGLYSLTVSDANLCTSILSTSLAEIEGPSLSLDSNNNAQCTNDNGSISVSVINGTGPFSYSWSHDALLNNNTATSLSSGTYELTVTDKNGCMDILNTSISFDSPPVFGPSDLVNETCDLTNGSIQTNVSGGMLPYNFTWSHDLSLDADLASDLTEGIYNVTVSDALGCSAVESNLSIISLQPPSLTLDYTDNENCIAPNGEITAQTMDGLAPFTFDWSHDASLNDPNATDLGAGSYTVTITDSSGCTETASVDLTDGPGAVLTLESSQDEMCGMSNGEINLALTEGMAPYIFEWSHDGSLNDSLAVGLTAGSYSITVTDANMCSAILNTILMEIDGPTVSLQSSSNAVCTNDNGSISLEVSSGTAPFIYSWSHDPTLNNHEANTLSAGNYNVTVTDANGCSDIFSTSISFDEEPTITLTDFSDASCDENNGFIQISSSGGAAPLVYEWSHDADLNNATAANLSGGIYAVTVTDAFGCSAELENIAVADLAPPILSIVTFENTACNTPTGTIQLETTDGLEPLVYTWSHDPSLNTNTATNLWAGLYSIRVTDASGCTSINSVQLSIAPSPELSLQNSENEICGNSNGEIDLLVNGGTPPFRYVWSHNATLNDSQARGLTAGDYIIVVTDAAFCTDVLTVSITDIEGPSLSLASIKNSICTNDNGEIEVSLSNGTPPFTYSWSHDPTLNNPIASSLVAGTYTVSVTDGNACMDVWTSDIDYELSPTLEIVSIVDATCENSNGMIQTTLTGGIEPLTYSWSHDPSLNAATASQLSGGIYSVTVSDALGCTSLQENIVLTDLTPPTISIVSFNNSDCLNPIGNIEVQTTGGLPPFVYTWSHDPAITETTASNLPSGYYTITVSDANGCESIIDQALIEFEGNLSITNELDCSYSTDGQLLLTLQGDPSEYDYEWNEPSMGNTHIGTGLSTGFYSVTVTNGNGCEQDFSINITAPEELTANISEVIPVGCNGNLGSIITLPTGGTGSHTYLWNDPNNQSTATASNLTAGVYQLLITDENGCTHSESTEVLQATTMQLTEGQIVNPKCHGDENGSAEVIVTEGEEPYTYIWNNNSTSPIISNISSGEYIVTVSDAVGCTEVLSITLTEPDIFTAESLLIQEPLCNGGDEGSISVTPNGGTAPYEYNWNDNQFQTSQIATSLTAGSYFVTITDSEGCFIIKELEVTEPAILEISDSFIQNPSCADSLNGSIEIAISGGTSDYEYIWNGGLPISANSITNLGAGEYSLLVSDANACTVSSTYTIEDPEAIVLQSQTISDVTCLGTPNGSITIIAEGGTQDLIYSWSNGATGNNLEALTAGDYQVSIVDALACEQVFDFSVIIDDLSPIDLGSRDTMICKNEVLFYDFSNTDYVAFEWGNLTEGTLGTDANFTIEDEASYYLYTLRDDGCEVRDTIAVQYTAATLDAFFIVPTDVVAGDTIIALEVTLPIPDSVIWEYDTDHVFMVEQINNQYLFHFPSEGEYDLNLTSFIETCSNDITKTIFVYADSTELPFINPSLPIILDLNLFPNPNSGLFSIDLKLSGIYDVVIDIYNDKTNLIDRDIFIGKDAYISEYEMDLPTGVYYALIQVAGIRRTVTFVID